MSNPKVPIKLQQLANVTAAELGLGKSDIFALQIALLRAYNLGLEKAEECLKKPTS